MTVAWCSRCGRPAPISEEELTGDGGGDPALLPVLTPPDGWIGDPDSAGVVCGDCSAVAEISAWMDDQALAEQVLEDTADE